MKFYTATRSTLHSPEYKYFDTLDALNDYYGITSTIEDYNKGFTFEYEGKSYLLGFE